jgi:cell division protein ZapA
VSVVEVDILGQKLHIKSDEDEAYIRAVEAYLRARVSEVMGGSKAVSTLDVALLAALNVTGELIKTKEKLEKLDKRTEDLLIQIGRRLA